jgi:DDE superfamily endonuclease
LDECTVHLTAAVKEALTRNNTEFDYIVPRYTSKLQPLDVGVNGPFKSYMRNNVESFMVINNHGTNAIKIHRRDVAKWVADCLALVTETTIQNSWEKCGGSNLSDAPKDTADERIERLKQEDDEHHRQRTMARIERHLREVEVFQEGACDYSMIRPLRPRIYTHPPRLTLGTDEELEKFKKDMTEELEKFKKDMTEKMMWKF